jgi:hypothetical protein
VVITDLKPADATNGGPPGQFADDLALVRERVEGHAMFGGPAVFSRAGEHGSLVSNVSVLEGELPHAEVGQPLDVPPHHLFAIDMATSHHARGSDDQGADSIEKLTEGRSCFAHQVAI